MRRLFGTDGIRGRAGQPPLDAPHVIAIGKALGRVLARSTGDTGRIVIGRDTRESGPHVQRALTSGLRSEGVTVRSAGVVPTPAISLLARSEEFEAGVVVSASHNPHEDNGLKFFGSDGMKLPDELEGEIERAVPELAREASAQVDADDDLKDEDDLRSRHGAWLRQHAEKERLDLSGWRIVVDCANGAASGQAGDLFRELGASVEVLHSSPDGRNINDGCGALHLGSLARRVTEEDAALGVAFDGDADRALFVDGRGREVDGDQVLCIAARWLLAADRLRGGAVVGTIMSNFGLERALREMGLELLRQPVGDRHVLQRLVEGGCNLGGEPSGHVIFLDEAPTGDGLLTALQLLAAVRDSRRTLAELADLLPRTPQARRDVRVSERVPLDDVQGFRELHADCVRRLAGDGRVVVRYSGTELVARVMVESTDGTLAESCATELADVLTRELGTEP